MSASSALSLGHDVRGNPITFGPGPDYDVNLPATNIQLTDAAQSSIRMMAAGSAMVVGDQLLVKRPWHVTAEAALSTIWPKIQTLVLSFSGLYSSEVEALSNFLDTHLGLEIGLLDWEHRYWRGVITTPDDPVVQDGPDSFSASFEFEGQLDPTWS